jgi:hypothetical protein
MTFPSPGSGPSSSARRSRMTLLLACGFLLLVVVCLVVVLLAGGRGGQPQNQPQAANPPATEQPAPSDNTDQRIPTAAPPGVSWAFFRGVALPQSRTYGPTRVHGDVAAGYTHSPTGALLAGVNIGYRYALGVDWRNVLAQQTVPGPGRQAWTAHRMQYPINADDPTPSSSYGQIAGFHFVNYTPELATIQLVTQFADRGGALQMTTLTVQWNGQDWLLVLQPDGGVSPTATEVTELNQFTRWSPS